MSQFTVDVSSTPGAIDTINNQGPVASNFNLTSPQGTITITSSAGLVTFDVSDILDAYRRITVADSPYTVLSTDYFISVDSSGGPVTVRLPNSPTPRDTWVIKDALGTAETNAITITTVGGVVTIDGATSIQFADNFQANDVVFNGTGYELF